MRAPWWRAALSLSSLGVPLAALAASPMTSGAAAADDATFVRKAAISDMYEVEAGKLAQEKATRADVKSFASQMVSAHTQTTEKLKGILASKPGMKPPAAMDTKHNALIAELRGAGGASFDKVYTAQQIEGHQQAVTLFTGESNNGRDSDLKAFASATLPTIQQHLSMAQNLKKGEAAP